MKKVIFICLLSLSACLSKPAEEKAPSPMPTVANASSIDPKMTTTVVPAAHTESQTPVTPKEQKPEKPVAPTNATTPTHTTDNKTSDKETAPTNETKPETKQPSDKPSEMKPASEAPKNETVTTEKAMVKPTQMPITTETPKVVPHIVEKARGFDGPSFIGGMVLTLGLLAIGFIGFKYYKNQTERNYHTL